MVFKIPWISLTRGIHYDIVLMVGEKTGDRKALLCMQEKTTLLANWEVNGLSHI